MNIPITPGEILLEEYLRPMGISQNAMARAIGVPPRAINEIVLGKRSITPAMSIRFGVFFGQSDTFWHGIQVECDFRALARKRRDLVAGIRPAAAIAPTHGPAPAAVFGRKNQKLEAQIRSLLATREALGMIQ
jgi:antitoxin HigA-1